VAEVAEEAESARHQASDIHARNIPYER